MSTTVAVADAKASTSKALHISLWVVQVLLAGAFGMAGVMKTTAPIAELTQKMVWPGAIPEGLVRFIGVSQLAAALGLVLPSLTRIQPKLTPIAAGGLVLTMVLAAIFHAARGEFFALPFNVMLAAPALFVAWGRWKAAPISAR